MRGGLCVNNVACSCFFFSLFPDVLSLPSCFRLIRWIRPASHICPHQLCASFLIFSFFLLPFYFILSFSEYIYRWYGCYFWCFFFWIFLFFSLFPNGFLLRDHGLDLWDRLTCEFNQSINQKCSMIDFLQTHECTHYYCVQQYRAYTLLLRTAVQGCL